MLDRGPLPARNLTVARLAGEALPARGLVIAHRPLTARVPLFVSRWPLLARVPRLVGRWALLARGPLLVGRWALLARLAGRSLPARGLAVTRLAGGTLLARGLVIAGVTLVARGSVIARGSLPVRGSATGRGPMPARGLARVPAGARECFGEDLVGGADLLGAVGFDLDVGAAVVDEEGEAEEGDVAGVDGHGGLVLGISGGGGGSRRSGRW